MKTSIFWDVTPCTLLKSTVTEEYVTSIFRVEETHAGCRKLRFIQESEGNCRTTRQVPLAVSDIKDNQHETRITNIGHERYMLLT